MGEKPVYESPKASRLDEHESVLGGDCNPGTGDSSMCQSGNSADFACFGNGTGAGVCESTGASAGYIPPTVVIPVGSSVE